MEGEGLERVHPAGEPFDPAVAEAVLHEPGEGEAGPSVADVLRAGYLWMGRVVRAAMVKVRGYPGNDRSGRWIRMCRPVTASKARGSSSACRSR